MAMLILRQSASFTALCVSLALGCGDDATAGEARPGREDDGEPTGDDGASAEDVSQDASVRDGAKPPSSMRDGAITARDATHEAASDKPDAASGSTEATDGGAMAGPPASAPTMCDGKPLPPRAYTKQPPFAIGPAAHGLPEYWPTAGFKMEAPEKLGFDSAKLNSAVAFDTPYATTQAVIVVRHGYVAAERYFGGTSAATQHESYSMAKSFTSALVGIAIAEGKIASTDDKICSAYPMQWDCTDASDPRSRITIDHAMNLTTGLMWREDWRSTATGANDAYSLSILDTALSRRATEEPGKTKRYSTGDPALLTGVLQKATGTTVLQYAKQKIFDVIGTPAIRWNADRQGRTTSHAGLQATAIEFAKFAYLYLQSGKWEGKQVVPADWIARTTQAKDVCVDWNQYLWHVNPPVRLGTQPARCDALFCPPTAFADLPADAYFAMGINGQFMIIVPSADLVVVRLANDMPGSERWDAYARDFLGALLDAIQP
jgi:CubicO group peptidase (beta-lactamase class C family)